MHDSGRCGDNSGRKSQKAEESVEYGPWLRAVSPKWRFGQVDGPEVRNKKIRGQATTMINRRATVHGGSWTGSTKEENGETVADRRDRWGLGHRERMDFSYQDLFLPIWQWTLKAREMWGISESMHVHQMGRR